ncbi:uncharacterized protein [Haliotis cracherodii]|uniref:uncharacterized protein n=1 Tax=Haliotis cracherodii TaxID=6455 RepID=UPI0039ED8879
MDGVVGNRVRLEVIEGDIYEGYLQNVDRSVGKLTLQKVTLCGIDTHSDKRLQGLLHFDCSEVKDLEILEDVDSNLRQTTVTANTREYGPRLTMNKGTPRHLLRRPHVTSEKLILQKSLSSCDENKRGQLRNDTTGSLKSSDYDSSSDVGEGSNGDFHIIDKLDEVFREAIEYIQAQKVIGVGMEGVCIGRDGTLCWLQVSTKEEVFLFDVLSLGSECFQRGLLEILESGKILKVMHDCRQPSDLLYHQFGVELVNVFDTQVAAVIIYRMEHNGDYPRYVEGQYSLLLTQLNMPLSDIPIIRYRETLQKEDQEVWTQRPTPLHILTTAVKQVKHLLPLRVKLMEKLLKEVTVGTEIYLGYVRDSSNEDSKRGLITRHLLPNAFQHLTTHMDFLRHQYMRPTRLNARGPSKDELGFDENCEGVKDPYLVARNDSVWRAADPRHKSDGDSSSSHPAFPRAKERKSLPNSVNSLSNETPSTRGHCMHRGPSEVRRPTTVTNHQTNGHHLQEAKHGHCTPRGPSEARRPMTITQDQKNRLDLTETKHGHGASHGLSEVQIPTTLQHGQTNGHDVSQEWQIRTPAGRTHDEQSLYYGHETQRHGPPDPTRPVEMTIEKTPESQTSHKIKVETVSDERIAFIPAGYSQNDLKKKRRHQQFSDSDLEEPIHIDSYSCPEDTDGDDSFSCIPSRESLGRHHVYEHVGSVRHYIETGPEKTGPLSDTSDTEKDKMVSYGGVRKDIPCFNIGGQLEAPSSGGESSLSETLPQNRNQIKRDSQTTDSDDSLPSISKIHINTALPPGIGRGVCRFVSPESSQSSVSSEHSRLKSCPSAISPPPPQEYLKSFHPPEARSSSSTSTPESANRTTLKPMVRSDVPGTLPYGRQAQLPATSGTMKTFFPSSSSPNDTSSSPHISDQNQESSSSEKAAASISFDRLVKRFNSKLF